MTDCLKTGLSIGNVYFAIDAEYPICLSSNVEKDHGSFRSVAPGLFTMATMFVSVVTENGAVLQERGELLGETSSWKVYKNGDGRELVWPHYEHDDCMWRVIIDQERLTATVYVGDDRIEEKDGVRVIKDIVNYPLDELLYMYASTGRDGVLVHSAGCTVYDDIGLIFCGKSQAGKSTISKQLMADNDFSLLSDDRVIIHKKDDYYFLTGTPWPGEAGISANRTVPMRALFFLHQSPENRIEPINAVNAFKQILPVVTIPWHERELLPDALAFCESATSAVPAFNIYFSREDGVAELIKAFSADLGRL